MEDLPLEIWGHLLILAPRSTLLSLCQVNRTLYELSQQEYIWRDRVSREYPILMCLKHSEESWFEYYQRLTIGQNARFICVTNNELNEYENSRGLSWGILSIDTPNGSFHFIATPERRGRIIALQLLDAPYISSRFLGPLRPEEYQGDKNSFPYLLHFESGWHSHIYLPRKYYRLILQQSDISSLELVVAYLRRTISGMDNDPVLYGVPTQIDLSVCLKSLQV